MIEQWTGLARGLDRTLLQLLTWLLIAMATMIPLERWRALRAQRVLRNGFAQDLGYYFLSGVLPAFALVAVYAVAIKCFRMVLPEFWFTLVQGLPGWIKVLATVVVGDFGFYWAHRLMHESPLLWRIHAIHHSPEHIDWLVATRVHPLEIAWLRGFSFMPVFALGLIDPGSPVQSTAMMMVVLFGTLWGIFIHANTTVRFKWLEPVLSTPRFHHWHHANDGDATHGKNYAALLPFLDRLFGTHLMPGDAYPRQYGSTTPLPAGMLAQLALQKGASTSALHGPATPA